MKPDKPLIVKQAEANVPTDFGNFLITAYSEDDTTWMPHLSLMAEGTDISQPVNVRIHSECITGEVFHSRKCECGQQLDTAMEYMQKHKGVIIYLRQEGRNIGIINKLRAYELQEKGADTVEANLQLGLPADSRDFSIAVDILKLLGIQEINLLTNNPDKMQHIENSDIRLNQRIPLIIPSNCDNDGYLKKKKDYFGHLLNS